MNRILAVTLLALLAGCRVSPASPEPTATPVELFRQLVENLPAPTLTGGLLGLGACEEIVMKDVGYDVQTTNSLVSPYVGTATFSMGYASGLAALYDTTVTLTYALQEGAWVYKDTSVDGMLAETCELVVTSKP